MSKASPRGFMLGQIILPRFQDINVEGDGWSDRI
jgi:hypothetical protein